VITEAIKGTSGNVRIFDRLLRQRIALVREENAVAKEATSLSTQGEREFREHFYGTFAAQRPDADAPVNMPLLNTLARDVQDWTGENMGRVIVTLDRRLRARIEDEYQVITNTFFHVLPHPFEEKTQAQWAQIASRLGIYRPLPEESYEEILDNPDMWDGYYWRERLEDAKDGVFLSAKRSLARSMGEGESMPQAWRRFREILDGVTLTAELVTRTEIQRVSNEIAEQVYQANSDVVTGESVVATLDDRCCLACAADDRTEWALDDPKRPVFPRHPRCRCFYAPMTKFWERLGVEPPEGTRAGWWSDKDGELHRKQVPANMNFSQWFGEQPAAFQRSYLGPSRYDAYHKGDYSLKGFVNDGKIIPLKKLSMN
jgi:SPP1 gp7 family putative phage head morphogenesis protein